MKKRTVALSVILGFLVLGLWPLAGQEERGPASIPGEARDPGSRRWLGLTPDQRTKLKEIKKLRQEALKGFSEQYTKMREEWNALLADPQADQKKVEGLIDEMAGLEAARMKSSLTFRKDMDKILTPQQLEKLNKAKTEFQRLQRGYRFFKRHPGARRIRGDQFFGCRRFQRPRSMRFRQPGLRDRMLGEY